MLRLPQKIHRARFLLAAGEGSHGQRQVLGELFRVLEPLAALLQRFILPGLELGALNLLQLELKRLHPAELFSLVHGQALLLPAQRLHAAIGLLIGRLLSLVAGEEVEVTQVLCLVKELLGIVLAMDVDEGRPQLFEKRHGDRPPVHPADVLSIAVDFPLDEQLLRRVGHPVFRKPR